MRGGGEGQGNVMGAKAPLGVGGEKELYVCVCVLLVCVFSFERAFEWNLDMSAA